ncbi:MAG: xseB [Planctomycetota bacterium]|nr:xseB [Planctomycetota bacterium]
MEPEISFETSLRQLEQTVKALEGGDLGLDAALAQYETGIRLLAKCHGLLDAAGRKVALLTGVNEDGSPATAPFDASATFEGSVGKSPAKPTESKKVDSLDDLPF